MLIKKIFNKKELTLTEVVNKKCITKEVYGKYLVRSSLMDLKNLNILDNNSLFLNISNITLNKNKLNEGFSFNAKNFLYKNRKNSALRFNSFFSGLTAQENIIKSLYESLKSLKVTDKILNSIIILKPVKGGFACYSSGIVGFLPRSHGIFFMIRALLFLIKDISFDRKLLNINFLSNYFNFSKKFFVMRLPFELGKITIYSRFKKNNFSSTSRRKKKEFLNDYNFVFLSQKIEKKYNKNKTLINAKVKKITGK